MTNEQLIKDLDLMTDPPFPPNYSELCRVIGTKFQAALSRHELPLQMGEESLLISLINGQHFVWTVSKTLINAGVPALEVWAIVKSTLEGKS